MLRDSRASFSHLIILLVMDQYVSYVLDDNNKGGKCDNNAVLDMGSLLMSGN